MGFLDKFKDVTKKAAEETGKLVKTSVSEFNRNKEHINAKRSVLINVSINDLKKIAALCNLDTSGYMNKTDSNLEIKRVKMTRLNWIDHVAKNATITQLIFALKSTHNSQLASDLEKAIFIVDDKYDRKKQEIIEGKPAATVEVPDMLKSILSMITKSIISFNPSTKHSKEAFYQSELLGYLKSDLEKKFGKAKVLVDFEHEVQTGKRLDLFVESSGYKVGLELKFDLKNSGQVQRLMGQIQEYSQFVDALIIADYHPIDDENTISNLKRLIEKSNIPLVIIAGGNEIR